MPDACAMQAHLASSGVSSGAFSTGLVPAANVWHWDYMVTVDQADNIAGQEDNTAGGSLQALNAAVADMAKLHAMSAGEVIAAGLDCCMFFHTTLYCDYSCDCHACCMACMCGAGTA